MQCCAITSSLGVTTRGSASPVSQARIACAKQQACDSSMPHASQQPPPLQSQGQPPVMVWGTPFLTAAVGSRQ
jgi:hypothetical protein